jgi:transposase InsO family protein
MESRGCRRSRAKLRPSASSRPIRSASSTSTSPKCRRARQALSLVAIDRPSKFAVAQFVDKANTQTARAFLEALVAAVPYRVEIVLTDNGIQFADLPKNRSGPTARLRRHPFDRACREHGIEHRLTKPNHPWTTDVIDKCLLAGSDTEAQ